MHARNEHTLLRLATQVMPELCCLCTDGSNPTCVSNTFQIPNGHNQSAQMVRARISDSKTPLKKVKCDPWNRFRLKLLWDIFSYASSSTPNPRQ